MLIPDEGAVTPSCVLEALILVRMLQTNRKLTIHSDIPPTANTTREKGNMYLVVDNGVCIVAAVIRLLAITPVHARERMPEKQETICLDCCQNRLSSSSIIEDPSVKQLR